ncbi:ABC transporter ATP-binding protein [Candidatus Marithioploca araucensis]|uniref:ABC-type dipeptide transporter n=1 Tax=Candidatus Marithioploca araucensis TaxID=70273 RepID=A0ABT7VTM4_9GAMM|nr:ABC transporter ATP-binding protein [Candidatus Marithioploca araucensis]
MTIKNSVLEVANLHVSFFTDKGELQVVQNVAFEINAGETVALVGESGCGKSVTALAIMGLIEEPGRITQGNIKLKGQELVGLPQVELQQIRGHRIGMIFQEPMTSLNPVFTIGHQIAEVLTHHFKITEREAQPEVLNLLEKVGIPSPRRRIEQYPHELSGGMKQRVMIAMALACKPDILIADEPTTALDVTIQAQIMHLLKQLQDEMGMAILLITHNLGVVAHFAQRVLVMYAGEIAEHSPVRPLFKNPLHPYTQALLNALPKSGQKQITAIQGTVPMPFEYPAGCRFSTRCSASTKQCSQNIPLLREQEPQHQVACWLFRK